MEEKQRKKKEDKQEFAAEVELVKRLQNEMENERQLMLNKRTQERAYLKKMIAEFEAGRQKAQNAASQEKATDVHALMEYG